MQPIYDAKYLFRNKELETTFIIMGEEFMTCTPAYHQGANKRFTFWDAFIHPSLFPVYEFNSDWLFAF